MSGGGGSIGAGETAELHQLQSTTGQAFSNSRNEQKVGKGKQNTVRGCLLSSPQCLTALPLLELTTFFNFQQWRELPHAVSPNKPKSPHACYAIGSSAP